jgi:hypothetical protein
MLAMLLVFVGGLMPKTNPGAGDLLVNGLLSRSYSLSGMKQRMHFHSAVL